MQQCRKRQCSVRYGGRVKSASGEGRHCQKALAAEFPDARLPSACHDGGRRWNKGHSVRIQGQNMLETEDRRALSFILSISSPPLRH